jgi:hypothetical protein
MEKQVLTVQFDMTWVCDDVRPIFGCRLSELGHFPDLMTLIRQIDFERHL